MADGFCVAARNLLHESRGTAAARCACLINSRLEVSGEGKEGLGPPNGLTLHDAKNGSAAAPEWDSATSSEIYLHTYRTSFIVRKPAITRTGM